MSAPEPVSPARPSRFGRFFWRDPNTQFLILAAAAGLLGGLGAIAFRLLTHRLTRMLMGAEDILVGAKSLAPLARVLMPAAGGLVGGLIAFFFFGEKGPSGISHMIEVVSLGRRTVRLRPSLARGASSVAVIATGGSEGREGPIIQIGAAFASALARRWKVSPERVRILTACGMAAGVAGAYNTPIAATLFVLEVVVGSFSMALFGPAVVSAVVSTIVVRAVLGDEPVYRMAPFRPESLLESLPYAAIGLIGGCASAFFVRVLSAGKRIFKATGLPVWATMAIGGALVGTIAIGMPQVYGNGFEATNEILHGNPTLLFLVLLLLAKTVSTTATIGSGGVGGVFTPSLLIGAAIGGAVAKIVQIALPHLAAPVGGYALLGMGGMLAGMTRAPLLAVIMIFELTQNTAVLLPMMVVSVLAVAAARIFQKESMYIESLRSAGIVWEKTAEATALASLKVSDIMRRDVALIPRTTTLPEIVSAFLRSRSLFLYIGDAEGRLEGAVDIHNIKESFTESELSAVVIAADLMTEIPFVTPEEPLTSVNEKLWFRDMGQLPVVDSRRGAQVPRRRHAARPARRLRRRGLEAQPPARPRAHGRRGGGGGLPRAAREAPARRGRRAGLDRRPDGRGGGPAFALRRFGARREAADEAGVREALRPRTLGPLRARRRARRPRQRGRHRPHPRRVAPAAARRLLTGAPAYPGPAARCYPDGILDKDRQALLAKEKQSELVALRGKWFKERTRLYDRETGLPTVAVLVDDLKKQLEELGSISVLVFRPSSEGAVEEVWGWEAYDDLLLDFVRRLKAFQTDGIVPGGTLCLPVRALGRDHPLHQRGRRRHGRGADRARAEGGGARPADPRVPRRARGRFGALPLVRGLLADHEGPEAPHRAAALPRRPGRARPGHAQDRARRDPRADSCCRTSSRGRTSGRSSSRSSTSRPET